jgi:hypothetical protein
MLSKMHSTFFLQGPPIPHHCLIHLILFLFLWRWSYTHAYTHTRKTQHTRRFPEIVSVGWNVVTNRPTAAVPPDSSAVAAALDRAIFCVTSASLDQEVTRSIAFQCNVAHGHPAETQNGQVTSQHIFEAKMSSGRSPAADLLALISAGSSRSQAQYLLDPAAYDDDMVQALGFDDLHWVSMTPAVQVSIAVTAFSRLRCMVALVDAVGVVPEG